MIERYKASQRLDDTSIRGQGMTLLQKLFCCSLGLLVLSVLFAAQMARAQDEKRSSGK